MIFLVLLAGDDHIPHIALAAGGNNGIGIDARRVRLLPSISAYLGSDVSAGILACEMFKNDKTQLLMDLGTNGEIVLSHKGKLYAASTAAGPALEGANISQGMLAVAGAIN